VIRWGSTLFIKLFQWQYCIATTVQEKTDIAMNILNYYNTNNYRFLQKQISTTSTGCCRCCCLGTTNNNNGWYLITDTTIALKMIMSRLNVNSNKRHKQLQTKLSTIAQQQHHHEDIATVSFTIPGILIRNVLLSNLVQPDVPLLDTSTNTKTMYSSYNNANYIATIKLPCTYQTKAVVVLQPVVVDSDDFQKSIQQKHNVTQCENNNNNNMKQQGIHNDCSTASSVASSVGDGDPASSKLSKRSSIASGSSVSSSVPSLSLYEVKSLEVTDPYGEKGAYSGSMIKMTDLPHGRGRMEYDRAGCWYEGDW
jgi:hypothetical protein